MYNATVLIPKVSSKKAVAHDYANLVKHDLLGQELTLGAETFKCTCGKSHTAGGFKVKIADTIKNGHDRATGKNYLLKAGFDTEINGKMRSLWVSLQDNQPLQ